MKHLFDQTPLKRSINMAAIKSKGNKTTEIRFIKWLRHVKITGWRRHFNLVGRPDLVFPREKLAVFLDGCYWHGCPRCFRVPSTNSVYWRDKINGNRRRDRKNLRLIRKRGWASIRIWECDLGKEKKILRLLARAGVTPLEKSSKEKRFPGS